MQGTDQPAFHAGTGLLAAYIHIPVNSARCLPRRASISATPPLVALLLPQDFDQNEGPLFEQVERQVEAARGEARAAELKTGEAVQASGRRGRDGRVACSWHCETGLAPGFVAGLHVPLQLLQHA